MRSLTILTILAILCPFLQAQTATVNVVCPTPQTIGRPPQLNLCPLTIQVGTVTALPSGSAPTVTLSQSGSTISFNFGIPTASPTAPSAPSGPTLVTVPIASLSSTAIWIPMSDGISAAVVNVCSNANANPPVTCVPVAPQAAMIPGGSGIPAPHFALWTDASVPMLDPTVHWAGLTPAGQ